MKNLTRHMMSMLAGAMLASGCGTIDKALIVVDDWLDSRTNAPPVIVIPPDAPVVPSDPVDPVEPPTSEYCDETAYSALLWSYGGFNGARATLDTPRIGALRMGRNLAYTWRQGSLAAWGLGHAEAGALACLFLQNEQGVWVGGKFDWISTSRTTRDFENLGGYNGWTLDGISNPCSAAFVIVSADGRRRSNVIVASWRR